MHASGTTIFVHYVGRTDLKDGVGIIMGHITLCDSMFISLFRGSKEVITEDNGATHSF